VEIKGDHPPYTLEVDGDNCIIRLATYEDLSHGFKQTQAFSQANNSISIEREEVALQVGTDGTTNQCNIINGHRPRIFNRTFSTNATGESINEIGGGHDTRIPGVCGPTRIAPNSSGSSPSENRPWDGKVTVKRKRRHHYQKEDSFDC